MLEIRTLGDLSLRVNGEVLKDMGSRKAEALLVYLAVEGRKQNRNVLATLFWPESNQEHALTSLRVVLSILRKNLGAYLEISRETVGIKPDNKTYLDLSDLEGKLAKGQTNAALEIYQGDFLQGFHVHDSAEFEDWLRGEQERVRRSVASALHLSVSDAISSGDYPKGRSYVQRLLQIDPLDERAHQQFMLLLALDDRRSAALAQYQKCRAILQEELGVKPSEETQELFEKISQGETLTNLKPAIADNNLPTPQTSFIGRETELIEIRNRIHDPDCRLLTLVGPGGSGKTRLALKAATNALRSFTDGIYYVPLESINSADYLVPAIANALKFDIDTLVSQLDPKIQLFDYLRNRSILLFMDGFEHLVDEAGLLSEMLDYAPKVKVIVTSRQRLNLRGEWTLFVEGLPVPQDPKDATLDISDAVRLFNQRAQQAKSDFQLTGVDYEHANHICQLVEGMPLGIELAATWTPVLSPQEITEEVEKSLDFLATETRDIPEKHRSLRAVFDSSWSLLTEEQQETVSKLSIFKGGFDRKAALEIVKASLPQLSTLLDKSLLRRDGSGYFTMHALLQQFAAERLRQIPQVQQDVRNRLCRYYVSRLTEREWDFMGPRLLQARDEIRPELENVRAAVDWACLHWEPRPIRKLLVTLLCFYIVHGWHEGIFTFRDIARQRKEYLLSNGIFDLSKDPIILSARIHQAFFLTNLGQIDESEAISRDCLKGLKELGLKAELSECLHNLGVNASFRGEYESAGDYLEEAILIGRECEHIVWPTYLLWLGHTYFLLGEYEQGLLSLRKCYEIFDQQGTLWGKAFALGKMGLAADGLGEHSQSMRYHREALEIFEGLGNQAGKGYSLSRMSMSAYFLEEYPQAVKFGEEGYQIFQEIAHRWGICTSLSRLGFAYVGLGDTGRAMEYFKKALQLSKKNRMVPLSMYALAGIACTLVRMGEEQRALSLFRYVQQHPQTPLPYLQKAGRWFDEVDQASLRDDSPVVSLEGEEEDIDSVIDQMLEGLAFD